MSLFKQWKIEQYFNTYEVYHKELRTDDILMKSWVYKGDFITKEEAEMFIKSHRTYYYD